MTTNDAPSFTHLESLLLFQSVAAYGNTADSFASISNSLKNSELLQRTSTGDNDRFNPQALTQLYLRLLKAEAKRSLENSSQPSTQDAKKGDGSTAPKRSDVPSPKIATIEDAEGHRHLEPLMINRLYDLYKDEVIHEITEDEQRYDELVGQVKSLEVEVEADAAGSAKPQLSNSASGSADVASIHDASNIKENTAVDETKSTAHGEVKTPSAHDNARSPFSVSVPAHEITKNAKDVAARREGTPKRSNTPSQVQGTARLSQPTAQDQESTEENASLPSNNLQGNDVAKADATRPLPVGLQRHGSPPRSPRTSVTGGSKPVTTAEQPGPGPSNLQYSTSQNEQRSAAQLNSSQQTQSTLPHAPSIASRVGGMQLPPFQVSPQAPHQQQQAQQGKPPSTQGPTRQGKGTQDLQSSATPIGKSLASGVHTPASGIQVPYLATSQAGEVIKTYSTPGSDTKWKAMPWNPDVPLPRPRSVSPLSDGTVSPEPSAKPTPTRKQKPSNTESVRQTRKSAATRARSKTPPTAHSVQITTRSQSEASHEDDISVPSTRANTKATNQDTPVSTTEPQPSGRQTRATRNAGTPAVATSTIGDRKRKRAPTIDTETVVTPASTSGPPSPMPAALLQRRQTVDKGHPNTIVASRNFHKTSAPMLNNIGSHKHASIFAAPVPPRTAGYYDIIKRPTDLSTIRKGIAAGVKAVNAATSSNTVGGSPAVSTPGGPGPGATTGADAGGAVTLPISKELVPPEGIVNSAQLEQEVMRMFANAVMFNEGDDGVVADTREMFEDTEKTLAAWRAAESNKESGEDGSIVEDGSGGAGVSSAGVGAGPGSVKRRRG